VRAGAHRGGPGGGTWLLTLASCLLLLLAAAQGYVSFRAQYTFIDHAKHARVPSTLEALGLDTGAVIFALLALSLARRGRRAAVERVLNVACAVGSLSMNLLAANLHSPRSITVWVMPSALYALASDRLIAVVRRGVLASESGPAEAGTAEPGSLWQAVGGLALWVLRLMFDVPGTLAGFRRWVLVAAPVAPGTRSPLPAVGSPLALPAADGTGDEQDAEQAAAATPPSPPPAALPAADAANAGLAPGESKRHALIRLYEELGRSGDPRHGDRTKAAQLASEIAGRIGYHPGTARRELARYLANGAAAVPAMKSAGDDAGEVA
jgi:hypothetical protein